MIDFGVDLNEITSFAVLETNCVLEALDNGNKLGYRICASHAVRLEHSFMRYGPNNGKAFLPHGTSPNVLLLGRLSCFS